MDGCCEPGEAPGLFDVVLVERCIAAIRVAETLAVLEACLDALARALGFDFYALIHHADLALRADWLIHLENYPEPWARYFIDRRLYRVDPMVRASHNSVKPVRWDDVASFRTLSSAELGLLERARAEGLGLGVTVPAHVPGECAGSCSFAVRVGSPLPNCSALRIAEFAGREAFQAARRILGLVDRRMEAGPCLSPQQRLCVLGAAAGVAKKEIAFQLSLSEFTVSNHLRAAAKRYGAPTRAALLMRSYAAGEFTMLEIEEWFRSRQR